MYPAPVVGTTLAVAAVNASTADGYIAYHLNLVENLVPTILWASAAKYSWLSANIANANPGETWGTRAQGHHARPVALFSVVYTVR